MRKVTKKWFAANIYLDITGAYQAFFWMFFVYLSSQLSIYEFLIKKMNFLYKSMLDKKAWQKFEKAAPQRDLVKIRQLFLYI